MGMQLDAAKREQVIVKTSLHDWATKHLKAGATHRKQLLLQLRHICSVQILLNVQRHWVSAGSRAFGSSCVGLAAVLPSLLGGPELNA